MYRSVYIVANKQQEYDVLNKLEKTGVIWNDERKPTEFIPSYSAIIGFPYVIYSYEDGTLTHGGLSYYTNDKREIVYDGRKEENSISVDSFEKSINKKELIDILKGFDLIKEKNMSDKYVVSQEFMDKLEEWKDTLDSNDNPHKPFVNWLDFENLPEAPSMWWGDDEAPDEENNNRLISIIRWVNGEDVFEVEKPKKWVVASKERDNGGAYQYVRVLKDASHIDIMYTVNLATFFDTKEEAQSWANSHQEVIEVEA